MLNDGIWMGDPCRSPRIALVVEWFLARLFARAIRTHGTNAFHVRHQLIEACGRERCDITVACDSNSNGVPPVPAHSSLRAPAKQALGH